jgi:protoporphyrinogen/coproporphyrinogen III oxidase
MPKLYNLEQNYGSFIRGAIKKAKEPKSERDKKATREIFSIKGGIENLVDTLVAKVGEDNLKLNSGEILVEPNGENKYHVITQ